MQWAHVLLVSLTPPGVTPESFQLALPCLGFCLRQSKTTVAAQVAEWPVLMCDPGRTSVLINEWVSLWDHCTVGGLGLHHSRKSLSHLRKLKPARSLVLFLQSKALMYFLHFYPDKFYNGSQTGEKSQMGLLLNHSAKTIQSPTMERPRHFSAKPWVFLDFFPIEPPYRYLSTGWAILLASFSQPPTQYLLTGWEFLSIFQLSPTQCLDHEWVCPDVSPGPLQVSVLLGGGR